jgi:hypothetical protein
MFNLIRISLLSVLTSLILSLSNTAFAVYDIETYKEIKEEEIKVNLLPSTTREANRIISF